MAGNSNSGRRPQPTALKILRGNPSKTPLNEHEPKPPEGPVNKPNTLSTGASAVWDALAPPCVAMGTLTTADVAAFRTLCELQATFDAEVRKKDEPGAEFSARLERETALALKAYYEKFGLEPAGRARIKVAKPKEPESKWAGLIGG